jgi:hypothetical protein
MIECGDYAKKRAFSSPGSGGLPHPYRYLLLFYPKTVMCYYAMYAYFHPNIQGSLVMAVKENRL